MNTTQSIGIELVCVLKPLAVGRTRAVSRAWTAAMVTVPARGGTARAPRASGMCWLLRRSSTCPFVIGIRRVASADPCSRLWLVVPGARPLSGPPGPSHPPGGAGAGLGGGYRDPVGLGTFRAPPGQPGAWASTDVRRVSGWAPRQPRRSMCALRRPRGPAAPRLSGAR